MFDAASKFDATSLNDHLLQGPDLMNSLVGILIRFRQYAVALIADIEAMFHQVRVRPEDCDVLRFLWWDDEFQKPVEYKMLVHIFGAKSSPCCANKALLQTADDNEVKYGSSGCGATQFLCGRSPEIYCDRRKSNRTCFEIDRFTSRGWLAFT